MADLFGGLKSYVLLVLGWCLLLDQATGDWGDKFKDHDLDFKNIEDRIEKDFKDWNYSFDNEQRGAENQWLITSAIIFGVVILLCLVGCILCCCLPCCCLHKLLKRHRRGGQTHGPAQTQSMTGGHPYPPQGQQPGYPPLQPGYPPMQPGHPPLQPGYPSMQPGHPPMQPGYPPMQPGMEDDPPPYPGLPAGPAGVLSYQTKQPAFNPNAV